MQSRILLAFVALIFAGGSAIAEPKAYELVKYKGKADALTIALDFADGYPEASHLWVTEGKNGKRIRFMLDDSGELRFVPKEPGSGKKEVVLKMSMEERPGAKIEGTYKVDGKQTQFTLRRID